jgi:hypothetical protein
MMNTGNTLIPTNDSSSHLESPLSSLTLSSISNSTKFWRFLSGQLCVDAIFMTYVTDGLMALVF